MSTAVDLGSRYDWGSLLRLWRELDVPEGWRAELSIEGVHMSPPPAMPHNTTLAKLTRALVESTVPPREVYPQLGVAIPTRSSVFIPDLCVADRDRLPEHEDPVESSLLDLVVEVTSPGNARQDRSLKKWSYAHGAVPLYLLVDRFDQDGASVTLHSEPSGGVYRRSLRVPFGESLPLPEPFEMELDTSAY